MKPSDAGARDKQPISGPLARNIDALMQRRRRAFSEQGMAEKLSARIAGFTGSIWSVLIHALFFGAWIAVNIGLVPGVAAWDPSLVVLAMIASVEAIFLTTFVLMNQRRQARIEDDRAELTLQISLLSEQETTKLAALVMALADALGVPFPQGTEAEELTQEVTPETILDEIERKRPE